MAENPAVVSAVENGIERPLCVDLDGTLVKSDTLTDSILLLVRRHPRTALRAPLWLLRGKAAFKAEVTSRVSLDVDHLPWNHKLLEYLAEQRAAGRKIYLTTGADAGVAERVAAHLGLFDGVVASDGATNQTGHNKLARLRERFAEQGFDYVGNASPDVPVLAASGAAMVANPTWALRSGLRSHNVRVSRSFEDRVAQGKSMLTAIRPHQWAKNILIFVPLLLAHVLKLQLLATAALAFVSFSLCASGTYIVNDLLDIDADRRHPRKKFRPFAAGDLSVFTGAAMVVALLAASFTGAAMLPHRFLWWLLGYLVATLAYSLRLKRVVLVDVLLLSGLYTLRLLAGAGAVGVRISPWFAAFSIFLFL